jgi:uncharacterized cupin superfamily protein
MSELGKVTTPRSMHQIGAAMANMFSGSVDASDFEPYPFPEEDILEGEPNSRVHWVRPEGQGSQLVGIFRSEPAVIRYVWEADETIHVIEGSVRIESEGGQSVELGPGGVASFMGGDRGTWHILEPFCELFVLTQ